MGWVRVRVGVRVRVMVPRAGTRPAPGEIHGRYRGDIGEIYREQELVQRHARPVVVRRVGW